MTTQPFINVSSGDFTKCSFGELNTNKLFLLIFLWLAKILLGKKITLAKNVEPKIYFANERTFLSWLNYSVILGGLAVGLLNFGDGIARTSASLFTAVAVSAILYSLFTFHWRARSIRQRSPNGFDDLWGPTLLAAILVAAISLNFCLRIASRQD